MSNLFVWKDQMQRLYAKHSGLIDRALKFVLGIVTFALIGSNVGFMKAAAQPVVTLAFGVIAAFIPLTLLIVLATLMILVHMYALSMGALIVMGVLFLVMYIFFFRFTPSKAIVVMLTPIAFALKVPYVIPIIFGLVGTPIYVIPVMCGTIVWYLLNFAKSNVTVITSAKSLLDKILVFAQQSLQNKTMWITVAAFVICLLLVYTLRRTSLNSSWKIAIVAGAVVTVVVMITGDVAFNIHTEYVNLIVGSCISIGICLILEFFVFLIDYSGTERLQFEDDEYYYYVKAVPKIAVTAPEKTVKTINERQETTAMDTEAIVAAHQEVKSPKLEKNMQETAVIDAQRVKEKLSGVAEQMPTPGKGVHQEGRPTMSEEERRRLALQKERFRQLEEAEKRQAAQKGEHAQPHKAHSEKEQWSNELDIHQIIKDRLEK